MISKFVVQRWSVLVRVCKVVGNASASLNIGITTEMKILSRGPGASVAKLSVLRVGCDCFAVVIEIFPVRWTGL